jgi:hypothetical protein
MFDSFLKLVFLYCLLFVFMVLFIELYSLFIIFIVVNNFIFHENIVFHDNNIVIYNVFGGNQNRVGSGKPSAIVHTRGVR